MSEINQVSERKIKLWRTEAQLWEKLKPIAREMRRESTCAERLLWQNLRNNQILGLKFRRQHNIERFIVDFYCAEARLVVEIDGPIHQYRSQEDAVRQEFIEAQGLKVIRFSNDEVINNINQVTSKISEVVTLPSPFIRD